MQKSIEHYREDLFAPTPWVILALIGLGMLSGGFVSAHPELPDTAKLLVVCLLFTAGLGWLISKFHERASGLFIITSLSILLFFAQAWFAIPGTLALLAIPIWLAIALVGWQAALLMTLTNTLALIGLTREGLLAAGEGETWLAAFSIWAALASVLAVYTPVRRLADWTWNYYQHAQGRLSESQDRQAQLAQALDDLLHANRQLTLLNERIGNYRQAAEEARRSKEIFVARVSHEFRAPLNIIIGMISLMVDSSHAYDTPLPNRALQHLEIIHRSCRHLASMIDDVLDLSQAEGGQITLHRETVSLRELIDSSLAIVRPLIENKGLELVVDLPEHMPQIVCDRLRIRQVFLNLLSNAARYTERGRVAVQVHLNASQVLIQVQDTGPGISSEDAQHIFEPFSPVGKELRRAQGGSGLGLSISKQFVELHGGKIELESKVGQGSTFIVRLPLGEPAPPPARPGQWISEEWLWMERHPNQNRPMPAVKPRLVICDETGFLYPALLHSGEDWELVDTHDLEQAVTVLRQAPAYSLVLNLPHLGDLGSILDRLHSEALDTPVVCCGYPRRINDAQQAGADGYILKPLTSLALERVLDSFDREFQTMLVVDDDEDTRVMMRELIHLYDPSIQVRLAPDGETALRMLRSQPPDLMLLDVVMPGMSGWEVLDMKQQDPVLKSISVIMVSAQDLQNSPVSTPYILASIGDGLSIGKLVESLSFLPRLMLRPG